MQEISPLAVAQRQLDLAAEKLKLDPNIHAILREPARVLEVNFPVRMDDGSVRVSKVSGPNIITRLVRPRAESVSSASDDGRSEGAFHG